MVDASLITGGSSTPLNPPSGVDDTTDINAVLAANAGKVVRGVPGQSYLISAPLIVKSGTTLDMTGTTVTLRPGSNCNMLNNDAVATGARDSGITVIGGTWARGANAGVGTALHSLRFRRVDGITVRDLTVTSSAGKYALNLGDVTRATITRISFATASDGVHFNGPAQYVSVRDITGTCGDDVVAFTAADYAAYNDVSGNISDVLVDGINATSTAALLKVIGGTGLTLRRLIFRNINGQGARGIAITDDTTGATDIGACLVDGVNAVITGSNSDVDLGATAGKDITIRNVNVAATSTVRVALKMTNWVSVVIDGFSAPFSSSNLDLIRLSGTVGDLCVSNLTAILGDTTTSNVVNVGTGATLGRLLLDRLEVTGGRCILSTVNVVGQVIATAIALKSANRLANIGASTDLTLSGLVIDTLTNQAIHVSASAALTVRGAGVTRVTAWNGFSRAGAEVIRVINRDYPADLSILGKAEGDTAYNTNAGLACGVGPAVSNGTNWKNVYSGATY